MSPKRIGVRELWTAAARDRWENDMARLVPRTIVVGIDATAASAQVLDSAFALAEAVAARVIVVHVVAQDGVEALDANRLAGLVDASRSRVGARLPSDHLFLAAPDAATGIVRVARREGADLIVVGNRRHAGDPSSAHALDAPPTDRSAGRCTRALLAIADCPVLAVDGDDAPPLASPCWRARHQATGGPW
jgi:nucleotide-binding universal stress UspA family protein